MRIKVLTLAFLTIITLGFAEKVDKQSDSSELKQGCGEGSAFSCLQAGVWAYLSGQYTKAFQYYKRGCDSGDLEACAKLGGLYNEGKGVKQDKLKAAKLYERSCDAGYGIACEELGEMYFLGSGVKQNYSKAALFFEKACDNDKSNLTRACGIAGILYFKGVGGVKQDFAKAAPLLEKGCENVLLEEFGRKDKAIRNHYGEICVAIGLLYFTNVGVKQDFVKAVRFFQKACNNGNGLGCEFLGKMYDAGKGVEKSSKKAMKYFKKACELGQQSACSKYKK